MPRRLWLIIAVVALAAAGAVGLDRLERRRSQEFAVWAMALRRDRDEADALLVFAGATKQMPSEEEFVRWERRSATASAQAQRAAGRLLTRRQRTAARRWATAQTAIRSARVALRALTVSWALFDYCTERQQFVARVVQTISGPVRAAALGVCFDQQGRDAAAAFHTIRAALAEAEAAAADAWEQLIAAAPPLAGLGP
ncbi:MAG TPA: hypothetical protein VNN19_00375 [bacterium]|nr:hypothetical protein [bacterium]